MRKEDLIILEQLSSDAQGQIEIKLSVKEFISYVKGSTEKAEPKQVIAPVSLEPPVSLKSRRGRKKAEAKEGVQPVGIEPPVSLKSRRGRKKADAKTKSQEGVQPLGLEQPLGSEQPAILKSRRGRKKADAKNGVRPVGIEQSLSLKQPTLLKSRRGRKKAGSQAQDGVQPYDEAPAGNGVPAGDEDSVPTVYYSVKDVADVYNVNKITVYGWIKKGLLNAHHKEGGNMVFTKSDVVNIKQSRRTKPTKRRRKTKVAATPAAVVDPAPIVAQAPAVVPTPAVDPIVAVDPAPAVVEQKDPEIVP